MPVIPAKAGIQNVAANETDSDMPGGDWNPAYAGMTVFEQDG